MYLNVENVTDYVNGISLSILMLNIRSCCKNFDQFILTFCNFFSYFTCIILTETWLTQDRDNVFNIQGFQCFNLYRSNQGGGIKIYVKDSVQCEVLNRYTFVKNLFEMLSIELLFCNHRYLLTTVYHPPSSFPVKNIEFIDLFTSYVKEMIDLNIPIIIAGDVNINLLNPSNYVFVDMYIRNLFEIGMKPLVTLPTKVNLENLITRFSVIDHVWVSNGLQIDQTLIIPIDITDHFPVIAFISVPSQQMPKVITAKRRRLTDQGKEIFRMLLSNVHVDTTIMDINIIYNDYFSKVFGGYNMAFPMENFTVRNKTSFAWVTPDLKQCIKKKARLYKAYLNGRISKGDYTLYKNRLTNLIRKAKALYYEKLILESAANTKVLWSTINTILNRKNSQILKEIVVNGEVLKGEAMVNSINQYFINAANTVTWELPQTNGFICLAVRTGVSGFFLPTIISEVRKVIRNLKNKGSKLLDVHPSVFKENIDIFSAHCVELYNLAIELAGFPDDLKIARVNPVHKSGPVEKVDNYRPISALPLFSKVFERLTLYRMNSFITRHNILTPSQFGFRRGCNTTHAIIRLLTHVVQAYHRRQYCACFFLDLRKAFDTINHEILLQKLEHYGFRGHCYKFLKSYFQNRKQYVQVNGYKSATVPFETGVPQGSILGPLCFSLYINDLPLAVEEETVLFADDAAFVLTSPTLDGLLNKIQNLFSDLSAYLSINKLVPNASKSKLMMFSSRPTPHLPVILFGGKEIEWITEFKYLGLTITNTLNFTKHINNMALNISRITGSIVNLRSMLPIPILVKLYYALAYPHISNHIVVWGAAPTSQIKILAVRVNNMLRVILGVVRINGRPALSNDALYKRLGLMTLTSVYKYHLFKFLKLLLDGKLPEFWSILMAEYVTPHAYNTRQIRLRHPALACEIERRAMSHQLILLYENVPNNIIELHYQSAIRQFKKLLFETQ